MNLNNNGPTYPFATTAELWHQEGLEPRFPENRHEKNQDHKGVSAQD